MIDRSTLREKIPHGYGKKIADKAGVTPRFVSKFLNDSKVNSFKVEMAALEVLAEISQKKHSLLNIING